MTAEWGRRLSDRLRDVLHADDYAMARHLCLHGDGYSRSLAKEFTLMFKGLAAAVHSLLDCMGQAIEIERDGSAVRDATGAAAVLAHRFRRDFADLLSEAALRRVGPAAELTAESAAIFRLLDEALDTFDQTQGDAAQEIIAAIDCQDKARALTLLDHKEMQLYLPFHDRFVRFMAETFAWALRHFGNQGLLRFHLATAQAMRPGFEAWERMPARDFARATAFLLKQHMSEVVVTETRESFTFDQKLCGSGGRLRVSGAYDGPNALPFVEGPSALTFGRHRVAVYCSHCPAWNMLAPLNWFGHPHYVFSDPSRPDGGCTLHIYKHPENIPKNYISPLLQGS